MKLFSPRETETNKNNSEQDDKVRLSDIRSELSREERELELFRDKSRIDMEIIALDFGNKVIRWNDELQGIQNQVATLRKERDELLKPLDDTPEKITENLAATDSLITYLTERKNVIRSKEKELDTALRDSERKLKIISEREQFLSDREDEIVKRNDESLTIRASVDRDAIDKMASLEKKNRELIVERSSINKKEVELAKREEMVAKDKQQIVIDRKRIESQQQSLITAMADAKRNKII